MADWEVTATTIFCDSVNDEVTVIVNGDGTFRCSGHQKYGKPEKIIRNSLKSESKTAGKQLKCLGDACNLAKSTRDKVMGMK